MFARGRTFSILDLFRRHIFPRDYVSRTIVLSSPRACLREATASDMTFDLWLSQPWRPILRLAVPICPVSLDLLEKPFGLTITESTAGPNNRPTIFIRRWKTQTVRTLSSREKVDRASSNVTSEIFNGRWLNLPHITQVPPRSFHTWRIKRKNAAGTKLYQKRLLWPANVTRNFRRSSPITTIAASVWTSSRNDRVCLYIELTTSVVTKGQTPQAKRLSPSSRRHPVYI